MGDIFGGVMDSFRGLSDDVPGFLSSLNNDVLKKVNMQSIVDSYQDPQKFTYSRLNEESTLRNYTSQGQVSTELPRVQQTKTQSQESVDFLNVQDQWIKRLQNFAGFNQGTQDRTKIK